MENRQKKVIVLGATGFAGSALLNAFQNLDDTEVLGLNSSDLDLSDDRAITELAEKIDKNTTLVIAVRANKNLEPFAGFQKDVAIVKNLGHCLSQNSIRKCIYLSGGPVYDDSESNLNITEESPIAPTSLYSAAKLAGENILQIVGRQANFPVLIFRPCKIYGPGGSDYGPDSYIKSLLLNGKVRLFGDGTEIRNHLNINDLAELTKRLAFNETAGIYNLVSGSSHTYQDILSHLRTLYEKDFAVDQMPRSKKKVDLIMNIDKLKSQVPDFLFTPIEKGVEQTFNFYLNKQKKEGNQALTEVSEKRSY
jgi:UDP-glucose 4-epimerase